MFAFAVLGTLLALSAGQPIQRYSPFQGIVPEGPQNFPQYQGSYNGQFFNSNNPFGQYQVIALVNNDNQPLGYVYSVNYEAVQQQPQNFIQVRGVNGNIVAYYSVNQYQAGQEFHYQVPSQAVVSQLQQFGFAYQQPTSDNKAFFVVRNPNVFNYNQNGVLSPRDIVNQAYFKGSYFPYYRGQQYYSGQQYPYSQQYQGPYAYQYQGPYSQYYPYQYQGSFPYQYQGSYPYQYQGSFPYQYNQYVSAY